MKYTDVYQHTMRLFLNGIKPAFAIPKDEVEGDLANYPRVDFTSVVMLFQNEGMKNNYIKEGGKGGSLTGKYLGYPPKAIKSFMSKPPVDKRVTVDYHGIVFNTNIDDLGEDLEWLHKTYVIPQDLQSGIEFNFHSLREKL